MLAMMGRMVVLDIELGMQMDPRSWSVQTGKPSHLQCFFHEAGIRVRDICKWFC